MSLTLTGTTSATGTFETAFTETFTAAGGSTPYVFSISAGSLPTGLSLDSSTGVISGLPSLATSFSFTVKVTDAAAATDTLAASIDIAGQSWCVINETGLGLGLTDRSNYLHQAEGSGHSWNLALRKRGQATIPFYLPAGDTYLPTRNTQIFLCDVTENGPVLAVEPDFEVYSTAGIGTSLLVGSVGDIPAGWEQPSFNDSSWAATLLQTGTTFGTAFAGSQWITPNTGGPGGGIDNDTALFRIPFTTSSVPPSGSLTLWSDNFNLGVWLNGVQVFSAAPGTTNLSTIPLPGSAFVSGTNVLAIEILNGLAWVDCDFVLTVNKAITTAAAPGAVWSGLIQNLETKFLDTAGNKIVTITAVSFESLLDTVICDPYLYTNQKTCGYIVADLLSRVEAGCPISAGVISDGATLPTYELQFQTVSEALDDLAKTSQFTWGVNPQTLQLFFQQPASITAPFTLGDDQILFDSVSYTVDGADYRTKQIERVSYSAFTDSGEFFVGANQTSFTLMRPVQSVTAAFATLSTPNTATASFSGQPSPGDTITTGPANGVWLPSHIYGPSGIVIFDGFVQQISFPTSGTGTSGSTIPTFSTITGDTVTDNTVIWKCLGPESLSTFFDYYTFVSTIDNTQWGQVLIGATEADTCQNLFDCINANAAVRGVSFSMPTWENSQVIAITNTGTSFTAQQKSPGSGWIAQLATTSSNFSWSSATSLGGTSPEGSLGPGEGATISLGVYVQGTDTASPALTYVPGSNVVNLVTPLNVGSNLAVEYQRVDADVIEVERTDLVIADAILTGGTGKNQRIEDASSTGLIQTDAATALLVAQTNLAAYCVPPQRFEFKTFSPGLFPGMTLPVSLTYPTGATGLLNGNWIIEEVKAEMVPTTEPYLGIWGHYQYSISMVDIQQTVSYLDFYQGNMSGPGQGGPGDGGAVTTGGGSMSTVGQGTLELETNGTDNGSQTKLNLIPGTGVTITDGGTGGVTIGLIQPYDVVFGYVGAPPNAAVIQLVSFPRTVTFPGNLTGSKGHCGVNPAGTATYTLNKNGTSCGTVAVSTGGSFTFTTSGGTSVVFSSGDTLSILTPVTDATLSDVTMTLSGTR